MSTDELKLPGVLPDMAGLAELTLARGRFTVVTASEELRDSMVAAISEAVELGGRLRCLEGACEKKSGEKEPSRVCREADDGGGAFADGGISNLLGGDAPVRAFLMGA